MTIRNFTTAAILFAAVAISRCPTAFAAPIGWLPTAAGTYDYNTASNWADVNNDSTGDINGIWSSSLTLAGTQNVTFAADTSVPGLTFNYAGNYSTALTSANATAHTLTLGGNITVNTSGGAAANVTIGDAVNVLNVELGGGTRSLSVAAGRTLAFANSLSNGGIAVTGGGTVQLKTASPFAGATTINSATLQLNAAGAIAGSDVTVNKLAIFALTGATGAITRANNVTLNGGSLAVDESANAANTVDTVTGALNIGGGASVVQIRSAGGGNAQLSFGSLAQAAGGTVLFRGPNLGVNSISSSAAGGANISFAAAPTLTGTPGGTGSTVGIIAGAYGDLSYTGTNATAGLVTFDADKGIRLLNSSEYTSAVVGQQTELDNVRYLNTGSGSIQTSLSPGTTYINSLSFISSGAGNGTSGTKLLLGGGTLSINSGVIFAKQTFTNPKGGDTMLVGGPSGSTVDLNGHQGQIIVAGTNGDSSTGKSKGPLEIDAAITNDGGNGLVKSGPGSLWIGNAVQSTYTGNTVVNEGILYFSQQSGLNVGLPVGSDLIINGGAVYQESNTLPDSANVTVNGGLWTVNGSPDNGSRYFDTVNNVTLTGGSITDGSRAGGSLTVLGSATITGGWFQAIGIGTGTTTTLGSSDSFNGPLSISNGGFMSLGRSGSAAVYTSKILINGGVTLVNTASGAYTPISISPGIATTLGGEIVLASDLSFVGNATNINTTTIASPAGAGASGVIALVGTRTFTIDNGAAAADLTIAANLIDGDTADGLIKAGPGTLVLSGSNRYSGGTTVSDGALIVNSSSALLDGSSLTVGEGEQFNHSPQVASAAISAAAAQVSAVPEPGMLGLAAIGLASLAVLRQRANKRKALLRQVFNQA